jgi:hypothetical protein
VAVRWRKRSAQYTALPSSKIVDMASEQHRQMLSNHLVMALIAVGLLSTRAVGVSGANNSVHTGQLVCVLTEKNFAKILYLNYAVRSAVRSCTGAAFKSLRM